VLASVLREDPRYYQKGTGSFTRRALWAAKRHRLVQAR
jgi:hypothetical protein